MAHVRMDKWLWAARFFKTRALAARACELGRIASNGQKAKSSREVRAGDLLQVESDAGEFQVEVVLLSEMRGPAAVAQTLYRETETSRELRLKLAEERKAMPHFEASREGKPSKRDRRQLDRHAGAARRRAGQRLQQSDLGGRHRRGDAVPVLGRSRRDQRRALAPHRSGIRNSHGGTETHSHQG